MPRICLNIGGLIGMGAGAVKIGVGVELATGKEIV